MGRCLPRDTRPPPTRCTQHDARDDTRAHSKTAARVCRVPDLGVGARGGPIEVAREHRVVAAVAVETDVLLRVIERHDLIARVPKQQGRQQGSEKRDGDDARPSEEERVCPSGAVGAGRKVTVDDVLWSRRRNPWFARGVRVARVSSAPLPDSALQARRPHHPAARRRTTERRRAGVLRRPATKKTAQRFRSVAK